MCLHLNRARLRQAGYDLAYPGRDGIPSGTLGLRLPSPRHGFDLQERFAARVARAVKEHASGPGGQMILSEENIPGRMLPLFHGEFFPTAEARLQALKMGLGGRVGTLMFVVREYGALYRSAWRKRAEDQPQAPFATKIEFLLNMDRGWPELLKLMQDQLEPERFVVIEYKARGASMDLLWRLVPGVDGLVEPRRQLNASVTEAALVELQKIYAQGKKLNKAEYDAIVQRHAEDRTPHGLTDLPDKAKAVLEARYRADLDRIRKMPGIDFFA